MISLKEPHKIMKEVESIYLVEEKSKGLPSYYPGNDYKKDSRGWWYIEGKTYWKEALQQIGIMFGTLVRQKTQ